MPRFYERPISPLEPLAEQGRFLLGMLMQRKQQQREDEYRERQIALQEQREQRVAETYELERAKTFADLERQGYEIGQAPSEAGLREPELPTELFPAPGQTAMEGLRAGLAERISGEEPEAAPRRVPFLPQPRFSDEVEQVGEPMTLGGELQMRYDPAKALEMAEMSPAYILAERERERAETKRGRLADELAEANAPDWLQSAVRHGIESPEAQVFSTYLRGQGGAGAGVTPGDLYDTRVEMLRQALILIRDRSSPEGRNIYGQTLGEIIDDVGSEFGLDRTELRTHYRNALRTGRFEDYEPNAPAAGGRTAETDPEPEPAGPEPATAEEIASARQLIEGLDPTLARRYLEGEYRPEDIDKILGSR